MVVVETVGAGGSLKKKKQSKWGNVCLLQERVKEELWRDWKEGEFFGERSIEEESRTKEES